MSPHSSSRTPTSIAVAAGIGFLTAFALGTGCSVDRAPLPYLTTDPDSIPEAYARSTAALAWPGATRAFQITPEGELSNGDWMLRIRPSCGVPADTPRAIAFENRWLPVAHWRRISGAVRWDFEAAALPEAGAPSGGYRGTALAAPRDTGLFVSLEIRATNVGSTPCDARLDLELTGLDSSAAFVAFDAPDSVPALAWSATTADTALAHAYCETDSRGAALAVQWPLAPGESRVLRTVLPAYPTPGRVLAAWAKTSHAERMDEARRHWIREVERSARFELNDPEVENALRAALVLLLTCRERRGDAWLPIGSPLHYRDTWLRDGARVIAALAVIGRTDEARAMANGITAYQWPSGAFVSQRGQLDGTGHAVWALEQAWLRPPPRADEIAGLADRALRAVRWIDWQRELGRAAELPFGAMLPFAEPNDNENVRAQLVGSDAWGIAAHRAAERLLRGAGRAGAADSVARARARYLADFDSALTRSGAPDVPPSWQGPGRDWGNMNSAWPCAAIRADHPRVTALARRIWESSGGPGLIAYGASPNDSLHLYSSADLGTTALLAGRSEEAEGVLAAMLAWRTASGGAAEMFARATRDYGVNLPPHGTSAAVLIALVRNAIAFDDQDTLRLTMGPRPAWWRGSSVRGLPTRFGTIDLSFASTPAEATWEWTPVSAWTALTLPAGTALAGAPPAPLIAGPGGRVVLAPPETHTARLTIAPAGGTP